MSSQKSQQSKTNKSLLKIDQEEINIDNQENNIKIIRRTIENNIKNEEDENYGICPITQDYMKNPVLSPSGQYYEKDAILDWIRIKGNDPLTREPLSPEMLIDDPDYKKAIIEYRKKHNK